MDEIEELLKNIPEASVYYAVRELHYGRLEWLAEHIRRCDLQISPVVALKILSMIEGTDSNCFFELRAHRRSDLPPRRRDPQLRLHRNMDMAIEVARKCGFRRGYIKRACHEVGERYNLKGDYVAREISPFREKALEVAEEERVADAFRSGEVDFLGRSKSP